MSTRPSASTLLKTLRHTAERLEIGEKNALFLFVGTFGGLGHQLPGHEQQDLPSWRLTWERNSVPPHFHLTTPAGTEEHLPATKVVEIVAASLALQPLLQGATRMSGDR